MRTCSIPGCEKRHAARGWCPKHYKRWRITGDPLGLKAAAGPEGTVSVMEAAELTGSTFRQLDYWIRDGIIPATGADRGSGSRRWIDSSLLPAIKMASTFSNACGGFVPLAVLRRIVDSSATGGGFCELTAGVFIVWGGEHPDQLPSWASELLGVAA